MDNFCLFGRCFCVVTLSNARPLELYDWGGSQCQLCIKTRPLIKAMVLDAGCRLSRLRKAAPGQPPPWRKAAGLTRPLEGLPLGAPRLKPSRSLPCPSFPCFFFWEKAKENHQKKQGFFIPSEPLISLEKKGKPLRKTRNSPQGKNKEFQKNKEEKDRVGG